MDVLNGFMLDGILGDFKEDELKLMHRNLKNINDLVNFKNPFSFLTEVTWEWNYTQE